MSVALDVYRDWLGIKEPARPLNHYQILRLKQFEDDTSKIREHYRKMNAHVRKYAAGEFAKQSQDLLNELAKAMLCLTDTRRKREYDATQGRKDEGDERTRSLEEILLLRKVIDPAQLEKARKFSSAVGIDLRDALVQQKLIKPDVVMPAYAESVGLPFLDVQDLPIDVRLTRQVPAVIARQHSCVPIMVDSKQLLMASPNPIDPAVEDQLRMRFGMSVRTVLCTAAGVHELINRYYSKEALEAAGIEDGGDPLAGMSATGARPANPTTSAPKEKGTKAERGPLTEQQKKERLQMTIICFNMTVALVSVVLAVGLQWGIFGIVFTALPAAAIVAGIVWVVRS
jgi:hypothetical protein